MIRKELNFEGEPFIVENGWGNTNDHKDILNARKKLMDIPLLILADQYLKSERLEEIRKAGIIFKDISDMSIKNLAEKVRMTCDDAQGCQLDNMEKQYLR